MPQFVEDSGLDADLGGDDERDLLRSWLGYRMADRKGKKSSPLDDIRPEKWTFTHELLQLIGILQHTIDLTPRAAELLDAVIAGPLVDPATLPTPTDAERKPPRN